MIFLKPYQAYFESFHIKVNRLSSLQKLIFVALLASLASLLQAAGGYVPIFGFAISPFTTLPIMMASLIALRYGLLSYLVTIFLLFIIEPAELFIFPFTTGLLGVGLGWTLLIIKNRLLIIFINGLLLTAGICFPLYILGFPVFGPMTSSTVNIGVIIYIIIFSCFYSFLWYEISGRLIRRLNRYVNL